MIYSFKDAIPKPLIGAIRHRACEWLAENQCSDFGSTYNRLGSTINIGHHGEFSDIDIELCSFVKSFTADFVVQRYRPQFGYGDSGYEYHLYRPGDNCFPHADGEVALKQEQSSGLLRFATLVLHLNTVRDGGETIFPMQNQSFKTIEGQVLLFPPYGTHPHYVTPSSERREIVMTWLVYCGINVERV